MGKANIEDKVVLITGSAQGIGYKMGELFAENGAKIVLSDINEQGVQEAARKLAEKGHDVLGIKADVTNEEDVKQLALETVNHFGRIDVLINNAGTQFISPIEDFPTDKFEQLIHLMLIAPFVTTKHVFPIMKEQKFGRILNMSSVNGLIGFSGKSAYNSAKHGIIGLTRVAALEGAEHGITVNAICPGYVDTSLVRNQLKDISVTHNVPLEKVLEDVIYPLVPQKRLLSVDEIADYAMFLASDVAKGITGQAVVIDGGYTAQ